MTEFIEAHEMALRLGSFAAILAVMALWELAARRREFRQSRSKRWFANLGMTALDSLALRLVFPAAAVGFAFFVEGEGWGLLPRIELPFALAVVLTVAVLDLIVYLQHVMFHALPGLWRFHMVHHSDQDLDLTTGVRFHPVEILLSMGLKFAAVAALGPPPAGVFLFEVLLNATSMFNHANVRLPAAVDRWLRFVLVTPDMHRVHHSIEVDEGNSNFGFNLPWWDRLFGTYRDQPRAGHETMELGVTHLQRPEARGLLDLLLLPFSGSTGRYAIGDRDRPPDPDDD